MTRGRRPRPGDAQVRGSDFLEKRVRAELYRVRGFFRRHGASPVDAEDWAHEVLELAWRKGVFAGGASELRHFLTQASHMKLRHIRRRPHEAPVGLLTADRQPPDPLTALLTKQARALVHASLGNLKRTHRSAILLHDIEGLRPSEAAHAMAVPLFTFYGRLRNARRRLAARLRQVETIRQPGVVTALLAPIQ